MNSAFDSGASFINPYIQLDDYVDMDIRYTNLLQIVIYLRALAPAMKAAHTITNRIKSSLNIRCQQFRASFLCIIEFMLVF